MHVVLPSTVIAGVIGGLAVWAVRPSPPAPVVRTQLDVQPADGVDSGGSRETALWTRGGAHTAFSWTPNGRALVFIGRHSGIRQIYLRDLHRADARPLAGTEGAHVLAVSADGRSVVFWAKGEIIRAPLDGGPAETLVPARHGPPDGVAQGVTGRVVFASNSGEIRQVSSGSAPTAVTSLAKGERQHALPQLLANDTVLLFTVRTSRRTWGTEQVVAQVLATGERKLLLQDASDARYVPSGHLVFLRRGLLMAVPFDLTRLAVTAPPVGVLDGVAQALTSGLGGDITGAGQFSVSASGALAYVPSPVVPYPDAVLVTVDRHGQVRDVPTQRLKYRPGLSLSPDGRRLAVTIATLTEEALWTVDVTRGSLTKLSTGGEADDPRWTPDAQRIAFYFLRDGVPHVAWQRVDGSAGPETLVAEGGWPSSWSPDGQHLATVKDNDVWVLTVGQRQPTFTRVTTTPEEEFYPEFSPDGRWLAYASDKTGRFEVYLRPYPQSGPSTPVSIAGGSDPAWNPKGGELFFLEPVPSAPGEYPHDGGTHCGPPAGHPPTALRVPGDGPLRPMPSGSLLRRHTRWPALRRHEGAAARSAAAGDAPDAGAQLGGGAESEGARDGRQVAEAHRANSCTGRVHV